MLVFLSWERKFNIFFSKFNKSSPLKALDKESIGTLWLAFLKFLDGLKPTLLDGEYFDSKKSYLASKTKISFLISSYSWSETIDLFLLK